MITPPGTCENCAQPGRKAEYEPIGCYKQRGGVECYEVGEGDRYVIICSDIFGYRYVNTQYLADAMAKCKFHVIIPDYLHSDPLSPNLDSSPDASAIMHAWFAKHPIEYGIGVIKRIIVEIEETASLIHLIGYCYGALPALEPCRRLDDKKIRGAIVLHGSLLQQLTNPEGIKLPVHFIVAEHEKAAPLSFVEELRSKMSKTTLSYYEGVEHGFACRPKTDLAEKKRQEALQECIRIISERS